MVINLSKQVAKLIERDGTKCHYCGRELNFTDLQSHDYRTVDHKKPLKDGGVNTVDNLVLACWKCNQKKGNVDYDIFVALLQQQEHHRREQKRLRQQRRRHRKSASLRNN